MNIGDLVRVKNIYMSWDDEPKPGYIMRILDLDKTRGYYVMVMEGKYFGKKHWISGVDLEVLSESTCKEASCVI